MILKLIVSKGKYIHLMFPLVVFY